MTPERPAPPTTATAPAAPTPPAPPTATYRLQLRPEFPFAAAEAAVPYLASLGVSHLHLSPVLEAVPGSAHGYDVVDPARVRAELGGEDGLRALARTARGHGLGLVLDIVPNHMAADPRYNRQLWQVLRDGPSSPGARWFDIDWEAPGGQLLLPVLAHPVGEELGRLRVDGDVLHYGELSFPLRAGTGRLPLPRLLDAQWYRLGWWRLARTELNYRRFFTVSELIGVRVEDPEVFRATHAKVLELLREGVVEGLRVDHPDGLADPGAYLRRLHEATGGRWTVVEKILADGEQLPASWPVAGTTGYDALRAVDGLFTDPGGAGELLGQYRRYTAQPADRGGEWEPTVRRAAYKVITHELSSEVDRLTRVGSHICAGDPALRDHAPWALRTAVTELLVRIPVYRPYAGTDTVTDAGSVLREQDAAEARAAFAVPEEAAAVDVVRDLALGRLGHGPDRAAFRARFAQTASALRAKSVEDTAFYRYGPLLSATEVGGDPGAPAFAPEAFHAHCARVQRDWPLTGTVLSTHDTKRSADVRATLAVLTECPGRWADLLAEVTGRTAQDGVAAPDPALAWAAWQTAVGLGEADGERLLPALLKHVREAGLHTSWTERDEAYEAAVKDFVTAGPCGQAAKTVAGFGEVLRPYVRATVLGAALLHLTMPGVPDLYQGTEGEYRALVDPDNRRPVRFGETAARALAGATRDAGDSGDSGDVEGAGNAGRTGDGNGAGDAGRTADGDSAGDAGRTADGDSAGDAGRTADGNGAGDAGRTADGNGDSDGNGAGDAGRTADGNGDSDGNGAGDAGRTADGNGAGDAGRTADGDGGGALPGLSTEKTALTTAALRLRARRPEVFGEGAAYEALYAEGPAAAHCLAFTRSGQVLSAVTRLSLRLADAGGWRDTALTLPPGRWRDLLGTGREFAGHARVAELFGRLPVALLERVAD